MTTVMNLFLCVSQTFRGQTAGGGRGQLPELHLPAGRGAPEKHRGGNGDPRSARCADGGDRYLRDGSARESLDATFYGSGTLMTLMTT